MTIDISTYHDGHEAREKLASQLHDAMTNNGFFVLTGHAVSEDEIKRQVDIGYVSTMKSRESSSIWTCQLKT